MEKPLSRGELKLLTHREFFLSLSELQMLASLEKVRRETLEGLVIVAVVEEEVVVGVVVYR